MAVQQHPIPQNVTAYQFRLVGDMTLKQFLQIGGGIAVGVFFYATKLPFFFKWPIIAFSVGLGAGMAFMPVEGRPLDQWLLAFIKSIYSPTIYTWKQAGEETVVMQRPQVTTTVKPIPHPAVKPQATVDLPVNTTANPPAAKPAAPAAPVTHHIVQPVPLPPLRVVAPVAPKPVQPAAAAAQTQENNLPLPNTQPKPTLTGAQPVFSQTLPIPSTPQSPNTIVGMSLTPDGHILDGAIVEIRSQGATIRATKSNKLGQFLFAQPLDDGTYQITAEKEGFKFPIFSLTLTRQIVSPIKLQANGTVKSEKAVDIYNANQTAVYA